MLLATVLAASLEVAQLLRGGLVAGERICDATGLRTFYARREHRAAWDAPATASLLRAIDRLADEGLQPDRYHRQPLMRLGPGPESDVLATDAFLLASAHLSRGVIDPERRAHGIS